MNRKLSLFAVLCLLISLCLAGCGGSAKKSEAAGYYKCIELSEDGVIPEEFAQVTGYGIYQYLVLDEDGTGYTLIMGEKDDLEWNEKQIWDDETSALAYSYEDGVLTFTEGSQKVVYEKLTGEELDDFVQNGAPDWEALMEKAAEGLVGSGAGASSREHVEFGEVIDLMEIVVLSTEGDYEDFQYADSDWSLEGESEAEGSSQFTDAYDGTHEDAGYYEIVSYEENGEQYHRTVLEQYDIIFDLMLYEDGRGYAHFMGDYYDLTWEDGALYVYTDEGIETLTYTTAYLGRNHIYIEDDISRMTFEYAGEAQ